MRKYLVYALMIFNSAEGVFGDNYDYDGVITNPYRTDGFGAQYQSIFYSMIYAEMHHQTYWYSPFSGMEHNYDSDPSFLEKKEWLVNLIDHFPINRDINLQKAISIDEFNHFFDAHMDECLKSDAYKLLKELFRTNKTKSNYLDESRFNIAVHIRRPNSHDSRLGGADTADSYFQNMINLLRTIYEDANPVIHIYSQGDVEQFKVIYQGDDIVFHINESVEDTFPGLVFADVLVTSASSFSYMAGFLSEGTVYYMPFWHPPLPWWIILQP